MTPSTKSFSGLMQRWALGILLGLSVSIVSLPELALAKSSTHEKSVTKKKSDQKTAKQKVKSKKAAKSTGKGSKKKTASKSSKKKSSGKSASKSTSGKKNKKVAQKSGKAKSSSKSDSKAVRSKQSPVKAGADKSRKRKDQHVWVNSGKSGQGYFVMPTNLDAGSQAAQMKTPQPVALRSGNSDPPGKKTRATAYQVGKASYYGKTFHGKKTASGERFDQNAYTCAHGSLPFGCRLRVTNLRNNKSVEVKVNDRGGFQRHDRVIDLSKAAAKDIGMLATGTAKVQIEVLE